MFKKITGAFILLFAVLPAAEAVAAKLLKRGTVRRPDGTKEDLYVFGKGKKGGFAAVVNKK